MQKLATASSSSGHLQPETAVLRTVKTRQSEISKSHVRKERQCLESTPCAVRNEL